MFSKKEIVDFDGKVVVFTNTLLDKSKSIRTLNTRPYHIDPRKAVTKVKYLVKYYYPYFRVIIKNTPEGNITNLSKDVVKDTYSLHCIKNHGKSNHKNHGKSHIKYQY